MEPSSSPSQSSIYNAWKINGNHAQLAMEEPPNSSSQTLIHCLILPNPTQGHINPILQFAKRLAQKNIKTTLALTNYTLKTLNPNSLSPSISLRSISDGFDISGRAEAKTSEEYQSRFKLIGSQTLSHLLRDLTTTSHPVNCVVYDPFMPWALDVAKGEFGLFAAAFFTQSCAVDCIYYQVSCGGEFEVGDEEVAVAGLPVRMKGYEMPSFIYVKGSCVGTFQMLLNQFGNLGLADWVFVNSFNELEPEALEWMGRNWRVRAIGPTIPSMYLDKRLKDDTDYGLSLFKPNTDTCINWLNKQPPKSVIYVSFGSLARLSVEQTQELARALTTCENHFLWVVRSSEEDKLPASFIEETSDRGLVVSWCPQLQVLAHEAVGCFVTHCGWNSTLEGLSLGVPMVAMPQWTDQSTNTKFVTDVWGMGIRTRANEMGLVVRDEIVRCIKHVMTGEEGKVMGTNAAKWKKIATEAVDEGGSSDKSIEEFVNALTSSLKTTI